MLKAKGAINRKPMKSTKDGAVILKANFID